MPPAADENDPRIGTEVAGRYQVRRVVADGGMGRVYEALDTRESRRLALKVLHASVAHDEVALERFKREFEISSLLPHEHIVEVFDFQRLDDGSYVMVMDYLEGEELRSVFKREKVLRPERLVRMLAQIALGLDEAHRRQLIHRDLKPDNIFLCGTREGDVVKLLDFGSVKDKSAGAKKLTIMGTTIGSPYYMSPEQAQGLDTLDARADVWALAAITYEALTGSVPFRGNNGPSILLAILTQEPVPPSTLTALHPSAAPIPSSVDDVLEEAFAKNPAIRVGSVGALADRMGQAYGLTGSHREWATTPVHVLADQINEALPGLLARKARPAAPAPAPAPAPATFAAEKDPFAEPDPFAAAPRPHAVPSAPPVGRSSLDRLSLAGVPKGPPLGLFIGLAVALVFVVAVVVVLIFR